MAKIYNNAVFIKSSFLLSTQKKNMTREQGRFFLFLFRAKETSFQGAFERVDIMR